MAAPSDNTNTDNTNNTVFNDDKPESTIKWLRSQKLNGIAAFDLIATAIGAFVLSKIVILLNKFEGFTLVFIIFILMMISAIGVHYIMEVPTMLNHYIGINTLSEVLEHRKL